MRAQRPNDARVRGAGPPRKTFIAPKACKAPHPLQPIVRRLDSAESVSWAMRMHLKFNTRRCQLRRDEATLDVTVAMRCSSRCSEVLSGSEGSRSKA
jgi:hypothetical protein